MELIQNLSPKYINGICRSYGEFLCPFCKQKVERLLYNGKKYKSCGCQEYSEEKNKKISDFLQGHIVTKETRQKISEGNKGKIESEETKTKKSKAQKGKVISEQIKLNMSLAQKDHIVTEVTKLKISEANKGKNNGNWNNGSSFEIYPQEFKQIKKSILERDNYECQDPNCDGNHKKLHIHHIDYDKTNNNSENLITLCSSCHSKTNGKKNRNYFTEYYLQVTLYKGVI